MAVEPDDPALTDEELVALALTPKRDRLRAFRTLLRRHQAHVLGNCRYLTRAPEAAEDLAQEVFICAYFGLNRFEGRASFKTWLYQIKINQCLTYLSKRARHRMDSLEPGDDLAAPALHVPATAERRLLREEERRRVAAVLDTLSDTLRVPLVLSDMDGLSYPEIAELLGIGLSAVKMRVKRARDEFRRRYRAAETEERER